MFSFALGLGTLAIREGLSLRNNNGPNGQLCRITHSYRISTTRQRTPCSREGANSQYQFPAVRLTHQEPLDLSAHHRAGWGCRHTFLHCEKELILKHSTFVSQVLVRAGSLPWRPKISIHLTVIITPNLHTQHPRQWLQPQIKIHLKI